MDNNLGPCESQLTQVEALLFLFEGVWATGKKRLLEIVDTIIIRNGVPTVWLFTNKEGLLLKKNSSSLSNISVSLIDSLKRNLIKKHRVQITSKTRIARIWHFTTDSSINKGGLQEKLADETQLQLLLSSLRSSSSLIIVQAYFDPCGYKGSGDVYHSIEDNDNPHEQYKQRTIESSTTAPLYGSVSYSTSKGRLIGTPLREEMHEYLSSKCRELIKWMEEKSLYKIKRAHFKFSLNICCVPILVGVHGVIAVTSSLPPAFTNPHTVMPPAFTNPHTVVPPAFTNPQGIIVRAKLLHALPQSRPRTSRRPASAGPLNAQVRLYHHTTASRRMQTETPNLMDEIATTAAPTSDRANISAAAAAESPEPESGACRGLTCEGDLCDLFCLGGAGVRGDPNGFHSRLLRRCEYSLSLKSVLLAREEAIYVEQHILDYFASTFAEFNAVEATSDERRAMCTYLGQHHIQILVKKLRKEVVSNNLVTLIAEDDDDDDNELSRELKAMIHIHEERLNLAAQANLSPGRFYMTVPMCKVCYNIYSAIDCTRIDLLTGHTASSRKQSEAHKVSRASDTVMLDTLRRRKSMTSRRMSILMSSRSQIMPSRAETFSAQLCVDDDINLSLISTTKLKSQQSMSSYTRKKSDRAAVFSSVDDALVMEDKQRRRDLIINNFPQFPGRRLIRKGQFSLEEHDSDLDFAVAMQGMVYVSFKQKQNTVSHF